MFTGLVTELLLLVVTIGSAPAADWKPFHAFMGSWAGTRSGPTGKVSVARDYESVVRKHLLISDRVGSRQAPWALVSADPVRDVLVLRRIGSDGQVDALVLTEVSSDGTTLVFGKRSGREGANAERITHQLQGPSQFVERVETRTNGGSFELVSETQFKRRN